MLNIQITDMTTIVAFWLAFSLVGLLLFFNCHFFENVSVPVMVKVLTTLIITFAFFPLIRIATSSGYQTRWGK